jgi:hypothetical protein
MVTATAEKTLLVTKGNKGATRMEEPELDKTPPSTAVSAEKFERTPVPEKRSSRILTSILRWVLGLLIVFGLGAMATLFALYLPNRQAVVSLEAQLEDANLQIDELESQVASLMILETKNQSLQEELDQANMHILLLRTLSNVNAARISLIDDDVATARAYLSKADTLKDLAVLMGPEQRDEINAMVNRLELALSELEKDSFAAQSDLEVLATNLMELKNTFFGEP